MRKAQSSLSWSFLWSALLLATYFVTMLMAARPVGMLFGDAALLEPLQSAASWAARAALALAIASATFVALPMALRRGSFPRRILSVAPIWLLAILALGSVATLLKVGTVGGLAEVEPIGDITFSTGWLLVFGVLTTAVMVPLAARATLPLRNLTLACRLQLFASIAAAVCAVAMVAVLAVVLTTAPAAPGGPGGPPGGPGVAPGGAGGPPSGPGAAPGSPGGAEATAAQAALVTTTRQELAVGVALIAVFGALALRSGLKAWQAGTTAAEDVEAAVPHVDGGSALPGAVGAALVLTTVVLVLIQPFRLPVDNPPPTSAAVWDSEMTAELVGRTCMDCHSNEGTWPWYAHVAPANWLTAGHVRSARSAFNLSELDKLSPDRRASLGERMARSFERGGMPPVDYKRMHPRSELTETEAAALVEGLKNSLAVVD